MNLKIKHKFNFLHNSCIVSQSSEVERQTVKPSAKTSTIVDDFQYFFVLSFIGIVIIKKQFINKNNSYFKIVASVCPF